MGLKDTNPDVIILYFQKRHEYLQHCDVSSVKERSARAYAGVSVHT